jgi:hypothetical protein
MMARAGHRCGLSYRALRAPLAKKKTERRFFLFFSCYRPVICRAGLEESP